MVTSLNTRSTAREAGYEMMQYITGRITATSGAITQRLGTIPSGSLITGVHTRVATAVASAAAMAINIGQSGIFSDLASGLSTAATGVLSQPSGTIANPLTADLEVWGQITSGATAGDAYISVWFQKPVA